MSRYGHILFNKCIVLFDRVLCENKSN